MKSKIFFLFILIINFLQAQTPPPNALNTNLSMVLDNAMKAESMIRLKNFKNDFESLISQTTSTQKLQEPYYSQLKTAYNDTKVQYDIVIGMMKSDLMDAKTATEMQANPNMYAQRYSDAYTGLMHHYQDVFLPQFNQTLTAARLQSRTIPPVLIDIGIKGCMILVDIIKMKIASKKEKQAQLQLINTSFSNPLRMKEWHEIVTYTPDAAGGMGQNNGQMGNNTGVMGENTGGMGQNNGQMGNNTGGMGNNTGGMGQNNGQMGNNTVENGQTKTTIPLTIPYPTMKEMKGEVSFVTVTTQNPNVPTPMEFSMPSRDLSLSSMDDNGKCFVSTQAYPAGTYFQIRTQNTALMYVFAFNSNNTCANFYPFDAKWMSHFKMGNTRDLVMSPLMLQDENNFTTIPSKNVETGAENYILISGNASQENMCVLISKSELDMKAVFEAIQNATGSLSERIETVFKENRLDWKEANVKMLNGKISFDAGASEKTVLPLVFAIKR